MSNGKINKYKPSMNQLFVHCEYYKEKQELLLILSGFLLTAGLLLKLILILS